MIMHADNNVAVTVYPVTTANAKPWRSILNQIVTTAPIGIVTTNEHVKAINVDKWYRPCAPMMVQHTIPMDIVIFPKATKGNNSANIY